MKKPDLLQVGKNSKKKKKLSKIFWVDMVKNGCDQSGHVTLNCWNKTFLLHDATN